MLVSKFRPQRYAKLYYLPHLSQIVITTAHWRTDGRGIWHLVNQLYEALLTVSIDGAIQFPWGQEVARLMPSVEEVLQLPTVPTGETEAEARRYFQSFLKLPNSLRISCKADSSPKGTLVSRLSLNEDETRAIVASCRRNHLSVNAAFHAALAAANFAFAADEHSGKPYTSTAHFSLRPYLPAPFDGPTAAAGLYTSGWMDTIPSGQTFFENASHYQQLYSQGLPPLFIQSHRQYAGKLVDMIRSRTAARAPSYVDCNGLGVAENIVQPMHGSAERGIEVLDISLGVELLSQHMVCYMWTFRGRMNFAMVYNEAHHDASDADAFLAGVHEVLKKNLSV